MSLVLNMVKCHNSKLLKIHNFIKNTINICLTALNDWKDVEIYSQKWRKSLQKR